MRSRECSSFYSRVPEDARSKTPYTYSDEPWKYLIMWWDNDAKITNKNVRVQVAVPDMMISAWIFDNPPCPQGTRMGHMGRDTALPSIQCTCVRRYACCCGISFHVSFQGQSAAMPDRDAESETNQKTRHITRPPCRKAQAIH